MERKWRLRGKEAETRGSPVWNGTAFSPDRESRHGFSGAERNSLQNLGEDLSSLIFDPDCKMKCSFQAPRN